MTPAIEFEGVSAGYHGKAVLQDIRFSVSPGEMVGILGPNGAGKTTLFRVLTGLCPPLTGQVRVFGTNNVTLRAAQRARLIGVVPQELETSVAFSVEEIVMMGRTAVVSRWAPPQEKDHRIVERAMVETDVADMRSRSIGELSGGEKQRAIVAMALAQEPQIILMDEATSHLDMNHRLEIMQIVERLNQEQGVTVLFISHDLNLAAEFCGRLLLLDHGSLVVDGRPADVLTAPTLRRVYHCDVRVQQDARLGTISVLPARRLTTAHSGKGIRIHVIAGGGSGEEVFRRLSLCGYGVTCGVLNEGDSDAVAAVALGMEVALEKPFSPVGLKALEAARSAAAPAQLVVLCGVPFGPGNVANLDIAEAALASGRQVYMLEGIENRDYTQHREAVARVGKLIAAGALVFANVADLLDALPTSDA